MHAVAVHAESTYKIRQLQLAKRRVMVVSSNPMEVGQILLARWPDGETCALSLIAVKKKLAFADVSGCSRAQELVVGQVLNEPAEVIRQGDKLTNMIYRIPAGSVGVAMAFGQLEANSKYVLESGSLLTGSKTKSSWMGSTIGYGVTDAFELDFKFRHQLESKLSRTYGPSSARNGETESLKSSGLEDLGLGGSFRWLRQEKSGFILDMSFSYSPKLEDAIEATEENSGNASRGGDLVALALMGGQEWERWGWKIDLGMEHHGASKSSDASTEDVTNSESYWAFGFTLESQYRVVERLYVRGSFTRSLVTDRKAKLPSGSESVVDQIWFNSVGISVLSEAVADRMLLALGYRKVLSTSYAAMLDSTPLSGTVDSGEWFVMAGFKF